MGFLDSMKISKIPQFAVRVENLTTKYDKQIIHDKISFEIKFGEIFALLGGSGCGKSTLLNTMIFLKRPSSGRVLVLGQDIWAQNESMCLEIKQKIGVCFQFGALFSSLSVLENITLPLLEYSSFPPADCKEIARQWLVRVGLEKNVESLMPSELSGGMIKRVALARSLVLSPQILFLDEPTSGLDPYSSRQFDALIASLKESLGICVVMVTHDMQSVKDVVDRFIVLKNKKVEFCGALAEIESRVGDLGEFLRK